MQVSQHVTCQGFPCSGVNHDWYLVPDVELDPADVSIVMISEAAPADRDDYYYANGDPLFIGYGIKAAPIDEWSLLLEKELALFPAVEVFMLMGDVYIARRAGEPRLVPAGSTYKIRGQTYFFRGKRAFHSYLGRAQLFHRKEQAEDDCGGHCGRVGGYATRDGARGGRSTGSPTSIDVVTILFGGCSAKDGVTLNHTPRALAYSTTLAIV